MTAIFHPEFPNDVRRFQREYSKVSPGLAFRFRSELDEAIEAIKLSPEGSGHFINLGSAVVPELRRRNLRAFPFFLLYGVTQDKIVFGAVIPSRSDPLTWLARLGART